MATENQYELIIYEVWGNAKEGFQVNQSFRTGFFISIDPKMSDIAINRRLGFRGVEWKGNDFVLYGTFKRNGCPAAELRLRLVYEKNLF